MRLRNEYDEPRAIDVSMLLALAAILTCMIILVFQSFQEPTPLEYTVQIQDTRDPNTGEHAEAENCINLYGPTTIFVRREYDMPLDEGYE